MAASSTRPSLFAMLLAGLFGCRDSVDRILSSPSESVATTSVSDAAQIVPRQTTASPESAADLVLVHGKVLTVDARDSVVEAVAARDGRIVAVGADTAVAPLVGPHTRVIDLRGRTVTPGLVDSHLHVMHWGKQTWSGYLDVRSPKARSKAALLALVGARAQASPPGEWISGNQGFSIEVSVSPDRRELDLVAPNNPVYLRHASGQYAIANSFALRLAGIDRKTADPPGGRIEREPSTREPTGRLFDYPAQDLVGRLAPGHRTRTDEEAESDVAAGQELALTVGYTSAQDVLVDRIQGNETEIYRRLERRRALKMRIHLMRYIPCERDALDRLQNTPSFAGDMLTFGGFKLALDGAIAAGSALMYDRNLRASQHAVSYFDQASLNRTVALVHKAGLQIAFHAFGDQAIDMALDAVEAAQAETPRANARHRIEHLLFPTPRALARMKQLGMVASVQPQWLALNGDGIRHLVDRASLERLLPIRTMLELGIPVAFGCDVPATMSGEPRYGFLGAVTRTTVSGETLTPAERISMREALRIYTMGSAYAAFQEKVKGSIEVGKLADFAVWSHDLAAMAPERLVDLKAVMTIVGGYVVYDAAE